MKLYTKKILLIVLLTLLLIILYPIYLETHKLDIAKEKQLSALLSGEEESLQFILPTQSSDCESQGPLPDPDCTPGAIFPDATKEEVCISGYSSTVRDVSINLKKKVFSQYGIEYPVPFGSYEIDHLIPLSLGGSNEIANLWPKSAEPYPGFYEKNITGNYLYEEVCKGNIALSVAQKRIADNWVLIFDNLDENTIQELKNRYKNWADRKIND